MTKSGNVFYRNQLAGRILEGDFGYQFVYAQEYLEGENPQPISLKLLNLL